MGEFEAAAASAVGNYASAQASNIADEKLFNKGNEFNAWQAGLNRKFQERMSNTAWQRAKADMEEAGFNPMLAFQQGGASTPSGGQATSTAAPRSRESLGQAIGSGINTALEVARNKRETKVADATIENTKSSTAVNKATAAKTLATIPLPDEYNKLGGKVLKGVNKVWDALDNTAKKIHHGVKDKAKELKQHFQQHRQKPWNPN